MGSHTMPEIPTLEANLVFEGYKAHCSAPRLATELVMIEYIRKLHADYHVVCTGEVKSDLLGFAEAGHAKASFDQNDYHDITRIYAPPPTRMSTEPAKLKNDVRFGRWKYEWKGKSFLLYQIQYLDPGSYKAPTNLYYILSPKEAGPQAIDELLLAVGDFSTQLHNEIYVFDDGMWSKDSQLWSAVKSASWDDVILPASLKNSLISDVLGFFDHKPLYRSLCVPWKRGLILHGVPGNGKTISIKALINALGKREEPIPSLYVKSFDACQGKKFAIRQVFMHARIMAPCLLIFEDLDSLVTKKTRSYFLNEVDGLDSNDGILMIGSTNHLETLDPAISKRPSRFDRKYHFKIPDLEERKAYCRFWASKLEGNALVSWEEGMDTVVARMCEGFSFAYLKELFVIALLTIARGAHLEEEEVVAEPGPESTDGETVIVEHGGEEKKEDGAVKEVVNKRILPEVEIPEHLKDNVLLKVIKRQLKMLFEEMDNTKEEDWPSSKVAVEGGNQAM